MKIKHLLILLFVLIKNLTFNLIKLSYKTKAEKFKIGSNCTQLDIIHIISETYNLQTLMRQESTKYSEM